MRLSPNPVFRIGVLGVSVGLPRHTGLRAVGVLGPDPDDLPEHPAGHSVRADVLPPEHAEPLDHFVLAILGLGLNEAAYMAEIIRAGISSVPEGQSEASTALGMSWWMTMRRTVLPAGDAGDHPAHRKRVHQHAEDHLAGRPRCRTRSTSTARQRDIAAVIFQPIPLLLVAATWYLLDHQHPDGGSVLPGAATSPAGISRKLTAKQLEALAKAQTWREAGPRMTGADP